MDDLIFDIDRSKPISVCWTCGRPLPEEDFEFFHQNGGNELDFDNEDKTVKIHKVLDDMGYPSACCRVKFLGDAHEFRRKIGLYDISTVNTCPQL